MTRIAARPMVTSQGELSMATQIRWTGLVTPVCEYRFDDRRRWRFDFAWPDRQIALEVEGGTWTAGRHTRGRGYEADLEKYNEAALAGWTVVRVTTGMVEDGRAIALLERVLRVVA
jgi:very-short-patch-repair endonuclease